MKKIVFRWRLLIVSIVLLFALAWQFNISQTISLIRSYNNDVYELARVKEDLKNTEFSSPSGFPCADGFLKSQDSFFHFFTNYCDTLNVNIVEINQYFSKEDSITIETNKFTLEGRYNDLLGLIYIIETERKINPLNAATFELVKGRIAGQYSLFLIIYIKRLIA